MRILVVTNMWPTEARPVLGIFVAEQVTALEERGHEVHVLHLDGPGRRSRYLLGMGRVRRAVGHVLPDLVHAHYGLTGAVAAAVVDRPLVVTFHGSDVFVPWQRRISRFAAERADANVFVAERQRALLDVRRVHVVPCGVDLKLFHPRERGAARARVGLAPEVPALLFASAFDNPVKRFELLRAALELPPRLEVELRELRDVARGEVPWLLSAVDALVLTSRHEGSPMVVKEALACGTPVVSVPVGDVPEMLASDARSRIVRPEPRAVRAAIETVLAGRGPARSDPDPTRMGPWSGEIAVRRLEEVYAAALSRWARSRD